jgi:hypothetical protein
MQMKSKFALAGILLAVSTVTSAHAALQDTFTWTTPFTVPQVAGTGSVGLGTVVAPNTSSNVGNAYSLVRVDISGSISEINGTTADFISDNQVQIAIPSGPTFSFPFSAVTSYAGATSFSSSFLLSSPTLSPFAGTPTFRFSNTFDDSPSGNVADAQVNNLTIVFRDDLPSPSGPITNVGVLSNTSSVYATPDYSVNVVVTPGQPVTWVKFTLPGGLTGTAGQFLDLDVSGPASADTVIGLYRGIGAGVLLNSDDDDGVDAFSALSYGAATPARGPIGNGVAGNARDGTSLGAGDYYLAIANYASSYSFGAGYAVTGVGTPAASTTYTLNIRTNVPEPTTLAMLSAVSVSVLRRRR